MNSALNQSKVFLSGTKIAICPFARKHLEKSFDWANDPELSVLMGRARPITEAEHEQWFANLHQQKDGVFFSIESLDTAEHIGNVWLWNIDLLHRKAELRIILGSREHIGRGMGSEAISLASDYAFDVLNLHKIYAYVLSINERAKHSFEKVGFFVEGILKEDRFSRGSYIDVFLLGRVKRPG